MNEEIKLKWAAGVKKIPYGISDYDIIRNNNYYYVDKTLYLKSITDVGRYLFFIRPRRFGKSLFIAIMQAYFDIYYKDCFEEFFKGTKIYDHPTEERGKYLIFTLDFSSIHPDPALVENSFLMQIQAAAIAFICKYDSYLSSCPDKDYYKESIKKTLSPSDVLSNLITLCQMAKQDLFLIIDEYDNFTNSILATVGKDAYHALTHGAGFFKSFFNVLKQGTSRLKSPIKRTFITGVSPVTMDDVTSGYNIGKNITVDAEFNSMLGFTKSDVIDMIEYYRGNGLIKHSTSFLLDLMTEWYGNYRFSKSNDTLMFNSDMVLYFLDNYLHSGDLPDDLIDDNVRIDYGKLRHLIIIDRGSSKTVNGNFSMLKEVIDKGQISTELVKSFPLEKLTAKQNFKSLLYYLGLLTIKDTGMTEPVLQIPNETIKRLFYNYISEAYEETDIFSIDIYTFHELMKRMALNGEWKPLIEYITGRMREKLSLRDLISGEKSIQTLLNVYLGLSKLYIIHTEKEMNKGFADIVMEPFLARYESIRYSYLIEIKYTGAGKKPEDPEILRLKTEAETQLKQYGKDDKFGKCVEKTELIKIAIVFSGHDAVYIGQCPRYDN